MSEPFKIYKALILTTCGMLRL